VAGVDQEDNMRARKAAGAPVWLVGGVLTVAMALSMLPLFLLGALGPFLVAAFRIDRPLLGLLVTVGFGLASILSLLVGPMVTSLGPRRCLIVLFTASAAVLAAFAAAPGYGVLVAAVAASGVPQALANPATNQLIAGTVPAERRGALTGVKQSGVQLGAFFAGLPLAAVAAAVSWRAAVGLAAVTALVAAVVTLALPADPALAQRPQWSALTLPRGTAAWLCGFSVLLGGGISAVNTYVALYATQQLRMSPQLAAALVAALGVAGIIGRIGWTRLAARGSSPATTLAPLAAGAVLAALALLLASRHGIAWAWIGTVGVGSCAVSANAVSMVTVIATARPGQVPRDSATVSAGFFAGFALGPPTFGALVEATGHYDPAWILVAVEFLAAALLARATPTARASGPAEPALVRNNAWWTVLTGGRPRRALAAFAILLIGVILGGLILLNRGHTDQVPGHQQGPVTVPAHPPAASLPAGPSPSAPSSPSTAQPPATTWRAVPPEVPNAPLALPAALIPAPLETTGAPSPVVEHPAPGEEPQHVEGQHPGGPPPRRSPGDHQGRLDRHGRDEESSPDQRRQPRPDEPG
jgi:predicted MFS family arabinose efflux permease